MNRLYQIFLGLLLFFTLTFGLVTWLDVPILNNPAPIYELSKGWIALCSTLLLSADIFLPIPGSIVMVGNGVVFGVIGGGLVSLTGGLVSTMIGFYVGRKGFSMIKKVLSEKEIEQANQLLEDWGTLIIAISRPIPLLSESVCIMAGASSLSVFKMLLYALLGYLPGVFLYAYAGAYIIEDDSFGIYSFLMVMGVSLLFWGMGRWLKNKESVKV